jgi:preprotein translocase subunit SecA
MTFLDKVLKVFVGDKSKQDVSKIMPIVNEIKKHEAAIEQLSNDELRAKSVFFRQKIADSRKELQSEMKKLTEEANASKDINRNEDIYAEIDKLKDDIYNIEKTVLDEILPEAFAVVKETAKRFKANTSISVTATAFDRELSATKDYVTLDGEKAVWSNSWDAAGKKNHLGHGTL